LDLIVWPEGAFTELVRQVIVDGPLHAPPGISLDEFRARVEERQQAFAYKVRALSTEANRSSHPSKTSQGDVNLLVGVTSLELSGPATRYYNSALWIDPTGQIVGRYDKMHLVMFGEYVPFTRYWPWLASQTPIGAGLTPGDRPAMLAVRGYQLSPSICFECTVPHLIRSQCRQLAKESGQLPDVLVSISDDGWFWGSSILDLHLACAIFRAVELRRPFVVAANTGISAAIDSNGRIVKQLPHRREGFIAANVVRDGRWSFYERCGDLFAGLCLLVTLVWGIASKWRRKNAGNHNVKTS
jgi:apolipoprotein N-acyltransferase